MLNNNASQLLGSNKDVKASHANFNDFSTSIQYTYFLMRKKDVGEE